MECARARAPSAGRSAAWGKVPVASARAAAARLSSSSRLIVASTSLSHSSSAVMISCARSSPVVSAPGAQCQTTRAQRAWSSMVGYRVRKCATQPSRFRRGSAYRRLGATAKRCAASGLLSPGQRRLRVVPSGLGANANIGPRTPRRQLDLRRRRAVDVSKTSAQNCAGPGVRRVARTVAAPSRALL
jgi:hypothetical protein